MALSPIDINANVNKLAELSKLSQERNNRSNVNISHAEQEIDKRAFKERHSVSDAEKESKLDNNRKNRKHDGKKKDKDRKKAGEEKSTKASDKEEHVIDIRI